MNGFVMVAICLGLAFGGAVGVELFQLSRNEKRRFIKDQEYLLNSLQKRKDQILLEISALDQFKEATARKPQKNPEELAMIEKKQDTLNKVLTQKQQEIHTQEIVLLQKKRGLFKGFCQKVFNTPSKPSP